jgi:hypothetical protein
MAVGVLNGNWRTGMYVQREREIKAEATRPVLSDAQLKEASDKATIRMLMGDNHLQEFIKKNFSLCARLFRLELAAEVERIQSTQKTPNGVDALD